MRVLYLDMQKPVSQSRSNQIRNILIRTLVLIVPGTLILAYLISFYHELEIQEDEKRISMAEINHIDGLASSLEKDLEDVSSDLRYLHSNLEFGLASKFFDLHTIPFTLTHDFLMFSRSKKLYDQLRVFTGDGMEKIRINFNNGSPTIVPDSLLQDKSDRYYFKESITLGDSEVFISPFDLNIEGDTVEIPVKPMIRFGLSISDKAKNVKGLVLANYLGDHLLANFDDNQDQCQGNCMLLNKDGFYLYHPDSSQRWGFMYPEGQTKNFSITHPALWDSLCSNESGQIYSENGLTTYRTISPIPNSENSKLKWILVTHIPQEDYSEILHHDEEEHLITFFVIFSMMITISVLVGVVTEKRYQVQMQIVKSEQDHRELNNQLQESNSIKELLLDVIIHDLKNPAGVIFNMSEMLHEEQPENEMIELIASSSASLQKVMDHSSTLSRISIGDEIELQELNLSPIIHEVISGLDLLFQSEEMTVEINLPEILLAKVNPIISEIFQNYLTNTIRYASEGKKVIVQGSKTEESVLIEVMDAGNTIPEQNRESVFIRKMQLEAEKKRGSGLGLAIVKRIAEMHGAEVGVKPNHPRGNNFWLKIPLV